ncbi:MAG TPA: FAD-binding oxidoreductase [Streptosporangiaceae bacterium]|nr:FAD-binding oxidoreductase [Streptosporangiaceae bacterium]
MAEAGSESGDPGRPSLLPSPGRRALLRCAAAAGGATLLSSCSATSGSTAASGTAGAPDTTASSAAGAGPGRVAAASGPPSAADWTALARDLSGPLVRPGEAGYATAKELFDPRFDSLHPAGIAYCRNPRDVATCLAFVRTYAVPVAVRCGGHSYAGWSSTRGLIVDVTKMAGVTVSGGTATVGAGTRLIDFYNGLSAHGRAVPGGSCPTVGIAGLTLGGGVGVVSRAYGLTSDNVQSLQIVTADGQLRTCNASTNPDLFWACRGGGGGNFGVVTSFTFTTHPAGPIVLFFLSWPWSEAARVISAWQSWAPHAPDELWSNLHLAAAPGGSVPGIDVGGTYLGSVDGAYAQLERLYAAVGSDPSSPFLESTTWLPAMLIEAGCASLTVNECHLPAQAPRGQLSRASEYAKSDFFTRPLSSNGIGTLLSGVQSLQQVSGAPGGSGGIAFDALGGAVNRVAPGATAYVHRDALFQAQYTTGWPVGSGSAGVARQHAWQRAFWRSMRPYASGQAYQNYIDPDLTNWRQAYYGANYARLTRVKAAYDPDRVFTCPRAV